MDKRTLDRIGRGFEQDPDEVDDCLDAYIGVDGFTVSKIEHPDHLWTILDKIEYDLGETNLQYHQRKFLQHFVAKWRDEIEPYCVRMRSE